MDLKVLSSSRNHARKELLAKYEGLIEINPELSRSLVSYQSNRNRPYYRWFKYKEGFSAALVEYALEHINLPTGVLLDPFAGSGAALLTAREFGWDAHGIELLPVGIRATQARLAADRVDVGDFRAAVAAFLSGEWRQSEDEDKCFRHLNITRDAFPESTETDLTRFRTYLCSQRLAPDIKLLLDSACLSILETISYTRKDGQYLRWDARARRTLRGKPFNKGPILSFDAAMRKQLEMMLADMAAADLFSPLEQTRRGDVSITQGSCLELLPGIRSSSYDLVITSPPYCNRYDYTRTYALELAYLNVDEAQLKELRQCLLSCTVENRPKFDELRRKYDEHGNPTLFADAMSAFDRQDALHEVLTILDQKASERALNNTNVPRMVRNYFLESSLVIFELARVVRSGGKVVMVNDNVQYAGEEAPVDLILCDLAAAAGFRTEVIWTLGRGKGNSSQQMGRHGRNELRKCAYVWRLDG